MCGGPRVVNGGRGTLQPRPVQHRGWAEVLKWLRFAATGLRGGESLCGDRGKVPRELASTVPEGFQAVVRFALVLECLHLLLEANEVVEGRDLDGSVEGVREMEHTSEVKGASKTVGLARMLDELNEGLVECKFA